MTAPEPLALPRELIRHDRNVGFPPACNQCAARSTADYLLFPKPDVRLCRIRSGR